MTWKTSIEYVQLAANEPNCLITSNVTNSTDTGPYCNSTTAAAMQRDLGLIYSLPRVRYSILEAQGCLPSKPTQHTGQGALFCTLKGPQTFGSSSLRL